jgi:hypothetical protein
VRTALDRDLDPDVCHAADLIYRRLADARAHAEHGDLPTANARLQELRHGLIIDLQEARVRFYHEAFAHHRNRLDPDVHQVDLRPDFHGDQAVRHAPILGRWLDSDVVDLIKDCEASLTTAALASADSRTPPATRRALYSTWHSQQHEHLTAYANRQLSDSQIAIYEAVGHLLVRPELR